MIELSCANLECGVVFGLPEHIYQQARSNPERWFRCPNGHQQHWRKSIEAELREKITRLESRLTDEQACSRRLAKQVATWKGIAHRRKRP